MDDDYCWAQGLTCGRLIDVEQEWLPLDLAVRHIGLHRHRILGADLRHIPDGCSKQWGKRGGGQQ